MPIYEFYCAECHTIFNFFSKKINTSGRPGCPKCGRKKLERQLSMFAMTGKGGDEEGAGDLPFDEKKMESAMTSLASEAEHINENDPRQAANLMRKFTNMTGLELSGGMEEALKRLESGANPDEIESEMGNLMDGEEDPFVMPGKKGKGAGIKRPPARDSKLHEM